MLTVDNAQIGYKEGIFVAGITGVLVDILYTLAQSGADELAATTCHIGLIHFVIGIAKSEQALARFEPWYGNGMILIALLCQNRRSGCARASRHLGMTKLV